jgi:hypothetical protein
MAFGKLEAQITIPTGDWQYTVDEGGGGTQFTLTAGKTYYLSSAGNDSVDLLAKMKAQIEGSMAGTYTITYSTTTGKVTIAIDAGTYSLTWDDTGLRDVLGFDANIVTQSTSTGADHAQSLWLPNAPHEQIFGGSDEGVDVMDAAMSRAPDGTVVTTAYNTFKRNSLRWPAVLDDKTRTVEESTTNESFQTWYLDSVYADEPWATSGGPVRWYPDKDTDATYVTYKVPIASELLQQRLQQNWSGYYSVEIPTLIKVP